MKKYQKPLIFLEDYSPSNQIAACGWDMQQGDIANCVAAQDPDLENNPNINITLFTETPRCSIPADISHGHCYITGSDDYEKIFTS